VLIVRLGTFGLELGFQNLCLRVLVVSGSTETIVPFWIMSSSSSLLSSSSSSSSSSLDGSSSSDISSPELSSELHISLVSVENTLLMIAHLLSLKRLWG
jgi:hypothetical protein